jgi:hypothetical protein
VESAWTRSHSPFPENTDSNPATIRLKTGPPNEPDQVYVLERRLVTVIKIGVTRGGDQQLIHCAVHHLAADDVPNACSTVVISTAMVKSMDW